MRDHAHVTVFIYALLDPRTGAIRYIGKTADLPRRLRDHLTDKAKCRRTFWIRSLKRQGLIPQIETIDRVPAREWQFWEKEYIRVFKAIGMRLLNATDGGDGMNNPSPETRLKLAANKGKKWSPERRAQYSALRTGLKHHVPMSDSHKEKLRRARIGKPLSEEHKKKISEGGKGVIRSAETRKKLSAAYKRFMTPERHAALIAKAAQPEVVAKRAAKCRLHWQLKKNAGQLFLDI